jgi:rhodanese-related sulfurtransferase
VVADAQKLPDVPLIINPEGDHPEFTLREGLYVPAAEVKGALDERKRLVIVDARAQSDYLVAHIPGALSVPFYAVDEYASRLPKDGTWIVAYCACPHAASGQVAAALRDRGFKKAVVLDEGVKVWVERGYPMQTPK